MDIDLLEETPYSSQSYMNKPSHNIHGVLFDMNGVLVNTPEWNKEAFNLTMRQWGQRPISYDDYEKNFAELRTTERLSLLADRGLFHMYDALYFCKAKDIITREIFNEKCQPVQRITDAVSFASMIFNGNIAVVTNCDRDTTELLLTKSGLIDLFKVIITRDDVDGKTKPHPWPYIKAQIDMGFKNRPKSMLAIDDTWNGISSAGEARCRTWKINSYKDLSVESIERVLDGYRITI